MSMGTLGGATWCEGDELDEVKERFKSNWLSQNLVRSVIIINSGVNKMLPDSMKKRIEHSFKKAETTATIPKSELPAFDMVRASVNLVIASVLISIATGLKLPLSTTYVTFMVAMGTSLADRAWGAESAVYRVAGVLNVIGGWFLTAFSAFTAAGVLAYLMYLGGHYAIIALFFLSIIMLVRNYVTSKKKNKEADRENSKSLTDKLGKGITNIFK